MRGHAQANVTTGVCRRNNGEGSDWKRRQQLSYSPTPIRIGSSPWFIRLGHGVENNEKLAHTGDEGQLLRLVAREELLVERPNHRVMLGSD